MSEDRAAAQTGRRSSGAFSAEAVRRHMAEQEATKAAAEARLMQEREERERALVAEFHKPPARTPEQLKQLVMEMVNGAAGQGHSEVQIYRFPNVLCSDRGRAINNFDQSWPDTLTARPQMAYEAWREHLKPLGFGLTARVLDYPGGMPGDIGLFLTW